MKALSFLGLGNYQATTYQYQGIACETQFFAEALPRFFPGLERILLFITPQVRQHANFATLQQRLGDLLHPVHIPDGHSEKDLWEIFDRLTGEISERDRVLFDITNSYRSLPFLVFLAAAFLRTARSIEVAGVLYGAYEARDANNRSPVFDLTPFISLLDWLTATNRFVETGDGQALADLLRKGMPSGQQMGHDLEARTLGRNLSSASEAIRSISLALRLSRPLETMQSAAQLAATLQQAMPGVLSNARPFALLAEQINAEYGQFALEEPEAAGSLLEDLRRQLVMIDWYLNRRHVIQAATLAREWVISLLAWKLGADMFDYEKGRSQVETALNNSVEKQKARPQVRQKSRYDAQLDALEEIDMIRRLWSRLREIRNDIAHCGMRRSPKPAHLLKQKVEAVYPELLQLASLYLSAETLT